ncbi:MAG: phosphoribosylformimino-5-aminoimidazole carboxamide ribotide isomerase [Lachnospiraceae bacterium]|nr:phosphoribosylformimino-5-aminoimidazole carboxamide ribotide isomerase [Lachnospiraceae bacterium]
MRFRPCIDIHNGKVKQIIGGSLRDEQDYAQENFVSMRDADYYAEKYRQDGLVGGHVIMLNPASSPYYEETRRQALMALSAYPGGLQVGGGITAQNAASFLEAGASHVIVTSYVFQGGTIRYDHLEALVREIGREHLVLDLSCRKKDGQYYIVTDRWQNFTQVCLTEQTLDELASYCDEFLIHAADVEGKASGIEPEVVKLLGSWGQIPMTYAGGVGTIEDLLTLKKEGKDAVDVTVGSALDLFGGTLRYQDVLRVCS